MCRFVPRLSIPMSQALCPCGSGRPFAKCCQPFINGQPAPSAETLMRSRYCAYQQNNTSYLLATTHPGQQARIRQQKFYQQPSDTQWLRLEIIATEAGSANEDHGMVEFRAWFRNSESSDSEKVHHERSSFARINGHWYFVFADMPVTAATGRNAPCPCGSGKKYKKCCGQVTRHNLC